MFGFRNITRVFESAEEISFDEKSKIVLMSDCHRGDGSWADDFSKNQNIYFAALNYYYQNDYIYIEIGDGDELWENKRMSDIIEAHSDVFWLLYKFNRKSRLYSIYGNHDIVKRNRDFEIPVLKNMKFHEGLVLRYKDTKQKILLIHGHQVDFFNYKLWRLGRASVKYLWKPLELFGINDPTSPAKNNEKKKNVGNRLSEWVYKERQILIAGHTHRAIFPEMGETPYFNDGSCVHPNGITAIEIEKACISLVRWSVKTREDGVLHVGREVLAGPRKITDYFALL